MCDVLKTLNILNLHDLFAQVIPDDFWSLFTVVIISNMWSKANNKKYYYE